MTKKSRKWNTYEVDYMAYSFLEDGKILIKARNDFEAHTIAEHKLTRLGNFDHVDIHVEQIA